MTVPNKMRGEVEITLGKKTFVMAPTFATIAAIEGRFGGVLKLMTQFAANDWSITALVGIIQTALDGQRREIRPTEIADAVMERPVEYVQPVVDLLTNALTGGQQVEERAGGNAEAERTVN